MLLSCAVWALEAQDRPGDAIPRPIVAESINVRQELASDRARWSPSMANAVENFWDSLTRGEADDAQTIMGELKDQAWAAPILTGIRDNGGIAQANKDRLFELRFAYALHGQGIAPQYEIPGEGESMIDFGFTGNGQRWRVEMVRLGETRAVKEATDSIVDEDGIPWTSRILHTDADDPKQSTEGETLKAVERICQKCESKGRPHKFPARDDAYHVMLVDLRTFVNGGDVHDRMHVALGAESVAPRYRLFWENRPITGVFSEATNLRGAAECRARVHFLGVPEVVAWPGRGTAGQHAAVPNRHGVLCWCASS
jgi:hypothetical protein